MPFRWLFSNYVIPRNAAKDKLMRRLVGVNSIHRSFSTTFSTGTTFTRDDKYFLTNVVGTFVTAVAAVGGIQWIFSHQLVTTTATAVEKLTAVFNAEKAILLVKLESVEKAMAIEKAAAEKVRAIERATAEKSKAALLAQHESVVKAMATEKAASEKLSTAEKATAEMVRAAEKPSIQRKKRKKTIT